jgi:hypothetical protein
VKIDGKTALIEDNHVKGNNTDFVSKICNFKDNIELTKKFASYSAYLLPNMKISNSGKDVTCDKEGELTLTSLAQNLKFAVAIDVSYDNKDSKVVDEIKETIKNNDLLNSNEVYLHKLNDLISEPIRLEENNFDENFDINFFGTGSWTKTYDKLDEEYDFVILMTNSDKPAANNSTRIKNDIPLYIVHSEDIPAYTTNITTDILQSGGFTFNNFRKALNKAILDSSKVEVDNKKLLASGQYLSYYTDSSAPNLYFLPDWNEISATSENEPSSYLYANKFLNNRQPSLFTHSTC